MKASTTRFNAILGFAGGVVGLGFVVAAAHVGVPLDGLIPGTTFTIRDATILGSLSAVGLGWWQALRTPTKSDGGGQ